MFARFCSDTFTLVWNAGCVVTLLVPLLAFSGARVTNEYNWEQNGGQNQNGFWSDYNNPDNYDEYGHYVGPAQWWQFWRVQEGGQNNNNNNDRSPWWYFWGQEDNEDDGATKGAVLFVYVWTLVCLGGLIYLGNTTGMLTNKLESFRWALVGFANYCLVTVILIAGLDAIESEGPQLEEDGWYGQVSVMLLLTCFCGLVHSVVFVSWTTKRIKKMEAALHAEKTDGYVNVEYESPAVQA